MNKVLMIDDDPKLGGLLSPVMNTHGLELRQILSPKDAINIIKEFQPEIILLDIMLPDINGVEFCRELRKTSDIPIIMVSALKETTDRVIGLEVGADDYVAKPFDARELIARIKSVLRRGGGQNYIKINCELGPFHLDENKRSIKKDGTALKLTSMEFELLALFIKNPAKCFSRDDILNELQGIDSHIFSRSIDILVSRLRQKVEDDPKKPNFIKTIRGMGYGFYYGEE